MWFSYDTGQVLVVVLCCLTIIGLTVWLFSDLNSSKFIGKSFKKKVRFGDSEVREFEKDDE
jgi:hypothetical protein